jgi:integrase/recombinase XerD
MTATSSHARRGSTYNNGQPYSRAKGRSAPTQPVVDRFATVHPVVQGRPSRADFVKAIVRELRIRFYRSPTIKSYRNALVRFLRWVNVAPHQVTREDVRCFLELMVDGGAGFSRK